MQRISAVLVLLLTVVSACSGRDVPPPADSPAPMSPPADSTAPAPQPAGGSASTGPAVRSYVALKACPFECCRYGVWRLRTPAALRSTHTRTSAAIATLDSGTRIVADSGIVIVSPVGLAVITGTPRRMLDTTRLPVRTGDTLELLDYLGEGVQRVRWRDTIFEVDFLIDSAGRSGVKLVRAPVRSWWVHLREPRSGWILMDSVRVRGADACSGEPALRE